MEPPVQLPSKEDLIAFKDKWRTYANNLLYKLDELDMQAELANFDAECEPYRYESFAERYERACDETNWIAQDGNYYDMSCLQGNGCYSINHPDDNYSEYRLYGTDITLCNKCFKNDLHVVSERGLRVIRAIRDSCLVSSDISDRFYEA